MMCEVPEGIVCIPFQDTPTVQPLHGKMEKTISDHKDNCHWPEATEPRCLSSRNQPNWFVLLVSLKTRH